MINNLTNRKEIMCKYCKQSESLFYDKDSPDVREVVVENGTLSIFSNLWDYDECKKNESVGYSEREAALMAQYSYSIEINYCPMCGRRFNYERKREEMEDKEDK